MHLHGNTKVLEKCLLPPNNGVNREREIGRRRSCVESESARSGSELGGEISEVEVEEEESRGAVSEELAMLVVVVVVVVVVVAVAVVVVVVAVVAAVVVIAGVVVAAAVSVGTVVEVEAADREVVGVDFSVDCCTVNDIF